MKSDTIKKIQALAERGVDGERANAKAMLRKIKKNPRLRKDKDFDFHQVRTMDCTTPNSDWETHFVPVKRIAYDIEIPYSEEVLKTPNGTAIWRALTGYWQKWLSEKTGRPVVQNSVNKITITATLWEASPLEKAVWQETYKFLDMKGICVIHEPFDRFGCGDSDLPGAYLPDRRMEGAIYPTSIYQYNYPNARKVPNPLNELRAIKSGDVHNYLIVSENGKEYWGFISNYDHMTGVLELQPRNRRFPSKRMHDSDIQEMYRVKRGAGYVIDADYKSSWKRKEAAQNEWEEQHEELVIVEAPKTPFFKSTNL